MNAPLNHPLPLLDLDVLRTFVAIAETGSFTTAANAVFRTPSAVSMQIKKLEDILGRSMFSRDARSVALTTDGEMLLGYARRLLAVNREAVSKFIVPDITGVVRLGSPDDYGERVLPHVLKRFAQTHPSIAVDVTIDQSVNLRRRMDDRALDITLVTNSYKNSMSGAEILLTEPIGLRVAGRRARGAWAGRAQLPCRLYERPHHRPAFRHPGRSRDRSAAEVLHRLRHGGTRTKGRPARDRQLQPGDVHCAGRVCAGESRRRPYPRRLRSISRNRQVLTSRLFPGRLCAPGKTQRSDFQ
jgi:DNA-binding transcriptional LysR family regulator